ncbi:unnamed protein product [Mytilus edulis]|uniref:Uncharacterized protein n=1 Tax=Mytilus edulis TaxID=6550 RepID=A0A8S3V4U8_MYTED|nr:unnamed protein product [Mytilus edulis]
MKDATQIEMDDIDFLCNTSEHSDFTKLQFPNIVTLSMKQNCVPLTFLCHIDNSNTNVYLDYNKISYNSTEDMPCEIHTKEFEIVSFSGSRINGMLVDFFMSKYTKTTSNDISLYFKKSHLRVLSFFRYRSLSHRHDYRNHVLDFSENFLEVFNGLEIIICPYKFTLNLEHNKINQIKKVTINTAYLRYYVPSIYLKYMNNSIGIANDNTTLIEIVGKRRYIYISVDLSFNKIYEINLATIFITDNNSFLAVKSLNVSHNNLEEYHNCLQNVNYIQILDFSYNKLRDLPDNPCRYGYHTYLGYNSITAISNTLPTVSISKLDLEWNLIEHISEKAFTNMSSLRILNLRGNKLKTFLKPCKNYFT